MVHRAKKIMVSGQSGRIHERVSTKKKIGYAHPICPIRALPLAHSKINTNCEDFEGIIQLPQASVSVTINLFVSVTIRAASSAVVRYCEVRVEQFVDSSHRIVYIIITKCLVP